MLVYLSEQVVSTYLGIARKKCPFVCECMTAVVTKRFIAFNEILHIGSPAQNFGRVHWWANRFDYIFNLW